MAKKNCCLRYFGCPFESGDYWTFFVLFISLGIITGIVLLAISIKNVDFGDAAVTYHTISKDLGTEILSEGRHAILPGEELKTFTISVITRADDNSKCISKDGLMIDLKINTQFRILPDKIRNILLEFGGQNDLIKIIDRIISATTMDVCSLFNGNQFFSNRSLIDQTMSRNVTGSLKSASIYIEPLFFQLKNIDLPTSFLQANRDARIAFEDAEVARKEEAGKLVQARTLFLKAEQDASIVLLNARAQARGIKDQALSAGQIRQTIWKERTSTVKNAAARYNMTASEYARNVKNTEWFTKNTPIETQTCLQSCLNQDCWYCWKLSSSTNILAKP